MIIAHDLGTSGNRASLHDEAGRIVATCTMSYPTCFAADWVAEQNPDDWWRAIGAASRHLLSQAGVSGSRIQAVALSGQMMGAVFLDGAQGDVGKGDGTRRLGANPPYLRRQGLRDRAAHRGARDRPLGRVIHGCLRSHHARVVASDARCRRNRSGVAA